MRIISFLILILIVYKVNSQERFCSIQVNKANLLPNDTLEILADYVNDYNKNMDGVLFVKVVNSKGIMWKYRWPIYNGICNPKIIIPANAEKGLYNIYFATSDEQFKVIGKLNNNIKNIDLSATLVNKSNLVVTNNIEVDSTNSFQYINPYFIDDAILFFKNTKKKNVVPDISVVTPLDSTFNPTTEKTIIIAIGNVALPIEQTTFPKKYNQIDVFWGKKVKFEETVIVVADAKTVVKNFEKNYIGDLFKEKGEKTLDVLSDDPGKYGQELFSYLQSNVPSISLERNDSSASVLMLRGREIAYYLDQVQIPQDFASSIDLNNIAIIKVFNPPFFGNSDANTGAVALFSKKNITTKNNRYSFTVKGYNAPVVILQSK